MIKIQGNRCNNIATRRIMRIQRRDTKLILVQKDVKVIKLTHLWMSTRQSLLGIGEYSQAKKAWIHMHVLA